MKNHYRGISVLILGAALLASATASAVRAEATSYIKTIRIDHDGRGIVILKQVSPMPSTTLCRDWDYRYSLAFDTRTDGGKSIYKVLLSAQLAGRSVKFVGTDACGIYSGVLEDIARVELSD